MTSRAQAQHLNPDQLSKNPAFTQGRCCGRPRDDRDVGGQIAVSSSGEIVGRGDIAARGGAQLTDPS